MSDLETLHTLISLFQDQREVTHGLWAIYTVTTFTAAAFSFKHGAKLPLSLAVVGGYVAFTIGHLFLVLQSIEATFALSEAIRELALKIETVQSNLEVSPSIAAAKKIAATANPFRETNPGFASMVIHLIIDFFVCVLILNGKMREKPP